MVNERQKRILNLLEERGSLSLHELIDYCEVSEATIRRDLTSLEEKNLLYRTHGGAMKRTSARGSEIGVEAKRTEFLPEKKEVAKYLCKNVVQSGQTIYLDAGTSTYEMIDYLRDRKITVVTNSTYHLPRLINNKIHTIILGGTLKHSTQAVIGYSAVEQLKKYSFDMCFVGCNGIDESFGVTTAEENEAFIKTTAIQGSKKKYILADKSKFGHRKFQKFAELDDIIIVSYEVPEEYKKFKLITTKNDDEYMAYDLSYNEDYLIFLEKEEFYDTSEINIIPKNMIENISEIEVKLDTTKENFNDLIDFEKDLEIIEILKKCLENKFLVFIDNEDFFETKIGTIIELEDEKLKIKEIDKYGNFIKISEVYFDEIQLLAVKNYKFMEEK